MRVWSLGQEVPWREAWRPTSVFLPGESYGEELGRLQSVVSERVGNDWSDLVQLSCSVVSDSLQTHGLQHARIPCPSPSPGAFSNSYPLSQWCHPTILSSVIPFSSCFLSFPASGSLPMIWLFASGGQITGASASTSILLKNTQDWFPLGLTGLTSLQSKELSRVFSNITVQKHLFFGVQPSLWSNSLIHMWLLGKP